VKASNRAVKLALPATPVPMFPLPGAFLFPSQILPLHVFEPRYRQMVEDSLDTAGRIVLATLAERSAGALPEEPPPVLPVASDTHNVVPRMTRPVGVLLSLASVNDCVADTEPERRLAAPA